MPPASGSRRMNSTRVTVERAVAGAAGLRRSSSRLPIPGASSMTARASAATTNQVRWTMPILPTVTRANLSLLHDLGDLEHDLVGEGDPQLAGGLEVDHEVEGHGPLDREVSGLGAFK